MKGSFNFHEYRRKLNEIILYSHLKSKTKLHISGLPDKEKMHLTLLLRVYTRITSNMFIHYAPTFASMKG